jgi:RNA methyltransferase, TrmH family
MADIRSIESLTNPLVKEARALREKKHRRGSGLFLAEGLRICTEARQLGALPRQLFLTESGMTHPVAAALVTATLAAGGDVIHTTDAVLAKLSGKDNPQAIIGIYEEHPIPLAALDRTAAPIWLVAQAMRDPGNLGTLLRTGDAVGAGGVILIDDCVDPFSVETVRASMGAIFTQAIVQTRWAEFITWLRSGPATLVGGSLSADSVDFRAAGYSTPCFVLVGNEARGLPADYEAACDMRVRMPMRGKADSLNAAVAAAVLAYQVLDWQERSGG